ncbi:hypothetical protein [Ferroplasma sp.]|uniref:hypothetical protein n=1 Tax=Ferroplasma sp. TaxID=2591003 RepID=UPI00307D7FC8
MEEKNQWCANNSKGNQCLEINLSRIIDDRGNGLKDIMVKSYSAGLTLFSFL